MKKLQKPVTRSSCLIINADDFGFNTDINQAILLAFSKGLCSSTTIMANMPGFEDAVQLCHENKLTGSTGLHLVICEGTPLTDRIKKCPRICDTDGQFLKDSRPRLHWLDTDEKTALFDEIMAQIDRCRDHGLPITHIDSHMHTHIEWGVLNIVCRIIPVKKIQFLRISRSNDPFSTVPKNLYRRFVNFKLRKAGYAATRLFGTADDYEQLLINNNQKTKIPSFELMIHPGFENSNLIDQISGQSLEVHLQNVNNYKEAISFGIISGTH